jgi:MFS transporter, DHA1 family, multidrug resistance protein
VDVQAADGSTVRMRMGERELIAFLAMTMALTALGIDLLLPAFPGMRSDFGLDAGSTVISGVITAFFVGLALGQLAVGPLADRFGRRPLLVGGTLLYVVGATLSLLSPTLGILLLSRFLWGMGAAAGRVLATAIVRDRMSGSAMARTMSLIMAVFVIVPILAPSLGAALLLVMTWRQLIGVNIAAAVLILLWAIRFDETLAPTQRRSLSPRALAATVTRVARHPQSGPLVLAQALLFGAFSSYLSTSEIVYGQVFDRPAAFPVIFGGMALAMGTANVVNGRIVGHVGLERMLRWNLGGYLLGAVALVALTLASSGRPPLAAYLLVLGVVLCNHSMTIPNMTSRALEPMGDVAGMASAINGAMLIGGGALVGAIIDRAYDGTVTPLALGFLSIGVAVAALVRTSERPEVTGTGDPSPDRGSAP